MVTLGTEYNRFNAVTTKLLDISRNAGSLDIPYQKLIAETLMLRLFYELDGCIEGIVLKLVRGTPYLDGNQPQLLRAPFRSQEAARQHILATHRKYYLEWTTLNKTQTYLRGIVDPNDHFLVTRAVYNSVYEDMRNVRNHVAHNTASTKARFIPVVRRIYANTAGISPAKYLLSRRNAIIGYAGTETVLSQYIRWSRLFVKTLTKSPI
ncbi:hypothetical protein [Cupriavidus sp. Agwp_2]|uniref:hypothetical protein n=1 Tax=Cupriavidus sp. Agwp_2 TaxID=2897324 RepID=UPI003461626C